MRDFMVAARTLLEGDRAQSVAAVNRIVASDFSDPEGLFYLTRHLSHLEQVEPALELFERVVDGGFFCFPAMDHDPVARPAAQETGVHEAASSGGDPASRGCSGVRQASG